MTRKRSKYGRDGLGRHKGCGGMLRRSREDHKTIYCCKCRRSSDSPAYDGLVSE